MHCVKLSGLVKSKQPVAVLEYNITPLETLKHADDMKDIAAATCIPDVEGGDDAASNNAQCAL